MTAGRWYSLSHHMSVPGPSISTSLSLLCWECCTSNKMHLNHRIHSGKSWMPEILRCLGALYNEGLSCFHFHFVFPCMSLYFLDFLYLLETLHPSTGFAKSFKDFTQAELLMTYWITILHCANAYTVRFGNWWQGCVVNFLQPVTEPKNVGQNHLIYILPQAWFAHVETRQMQSSL